MPRCFFDHRIVGFIAAGMAGVTSNAIGQAIPDTQPTNNTALQSSAAWMERNLAEAAVIRDQCLLWDHMQGTTSIGGYGLTRAFQPPRHTPPHAGTGSGDKSPIDWTLSPDPLETLTMRVQAYILADDDGGRQTPITPAQIRIWVDQANLIFASSSIYFEFDPAEGSKDWIELNSTLLNSFSGDSNPQWVQQRDTANALAALNADKMCVFFRWGNGSNPTGGGFSWTDNDFIVMPGFGPTQVCDEQNIGLLAHEAGHYLGLPHTFRYIAESIERAESLYVSNRHNPLIFEGDGRDETHADPFIQTFATQCILDTLNFDGQNFPLPRDNAMSYYHPVSTFVPSQSSTMRQTLMLRTGQSIAGNNNPINPVEGEDLISSTTGGQVSTQDMRGFLGRWSGDTQLLWIDGQIGDTLSTTIIAPSNGRYRLYGSFTAAPDFGIFEHRLNGQTSNQIDLLASNIVLNTGQVYIGDFGLEKGENDLQIIIAGSNPLITFPRFGYGLDYFFLEALCPADLTDDGQLDFFDVSAFLDAFAKQDRLVDFTSDGLFDFFDVSAFLDAFAQGCP